MVSLSFNREQHPVDHPLTVCSDLVYLVAKMASRTQPLAADFLHSRKHLGLVGL